MDQGNTQRYFEKLARANFGECGMVLHITYSAGGENGATSVQKYLRRCLSLGACRKGKKT